LFNFSIFLLNLIIFLNISLNIFCIDFMETDERLLVPAHHQFTIPLLAFPILIKLFSITRELGLYFSNVVTTKSNKVVAPSFAVTSSICYLLIMYYVMIGYL
jgi:hypothetical protein